MITVSLWREKTNSANTDLSYEQSVPIAGNSSSPSEDFHIVMTNTGEKIISEVSFQFPK